MSNMHFCKYCNIDHPKTDEFWSFSKEGWIKSCLKRKRDFDKKYYHSMDDNQKIKERIRLRNLYYKDHENQIRRSSEYRKNNPEKRREIVKKSDQKHRDRKKQYHLNRLKTNPNYALSNKLRTRLKMILKSQGLCPKTNISEFIGCSWDEARKYLESKFQPGMTWENHGRYTWHIDHIRPLISFDLTDIEQRKMAFHYTNLQPLWAKDNLSKGAKVG